MAIFNLNVIVRFRYLNQLLSLAVFLVSSTVLNVSRCGIGCLKVLLSALIYWIQPHE
jgi:hypothetical protein